MKSILTKYQSQRSFDVVIAGAGIAGSSLAIQLARAGHHVALCDQAPIGQNKLSTHFLWPKAVSYLNRLGVSVERDLKAPVFESIRLSLEGHAVYGPVSLTQLQGRLRQTHGDSYGATRSYSCVRRQILDSHLIGLSIDAGVSYFAERSLVHVERNKISSCVEQIRLADKNSNEVVLNAKAFVAADGRNSTFAKLTKNPFIETHEASTASVWSYFEGIPPQGVRLAKKGSRGYGATSTNDGKTMILYWGRSQDRNEIFKLKDQDFMKEIYQMDPEMGAALSNAKRVEPFYRCSDLPSFRRKSTHCGVYFMGDSVCFKDQCSASGITHALADAELAFASLDRMLGENLSPEDARLSYSYKREADRKDYFALACEMAKMTPASCEEVLSHQECALDPGATSAFLTLCSDSNRLSPEAQAMLNTHTEKSLRSQYYEPVPCTLA